MLSSGGFFGSMQMPNGASSFMSPGDIDSSMPNAGGAGGLSQLLPFLAAAISKFAPQGQDKGQDGAPSALPSNATLAPGAALPGAPPAQIGGLGQASQQLPAGGPPDLMKALMSMDPATLKGIVQRLGIGGNQSASPDIGGMTAVQLDNYNALRKRGFSSSDAYNMMLQNGRGQ